jgi:hypothetical protein
MVPTHAQLRFRPPHQISIHFSTKDIFMPRPRVPLLKAQTTGRVLRNPKRFKDRAEPPSGGPLGKPPKWLSKPHEREAWETLSNDLPWLNKSHRTLVALASGLLARQIAGGEVGVKAMNLLRMILGSMGATPSDASKVKMPEEQDDNDPSTKYF